MHDHENYRFKNFCERILLRRENSNMIKKTSKQGNVRCKHSNNFCIKRTPHHYNQQHYRQNISYHPLFTADFSHNDWLQRIKFKDTWHHHNTTLKVFFHTKMRQKWFYYCFETLPRLQHYRAPPQSSATVHKIDWSSHFPDEHRLAT